MAARRERRPSGASGGKGRAAARPLVLDEKLDTTQAKALAAILLERRGAPLSIEAGMVRHLGAQCAQVLLSARNTWAHDGQDFAITTASEGFGEGLRSLGLANDLEVTGA